MPVNLLRSHFFAFKEASAWGRFLAIPIMRVMVCSAVERVFASGVFITITPFAVAAAMSTLSTPTPARPMTFNFFTFSRVFAVTFEALLIISAS